MAELIDGRAIAASIQERVQQQRDQLEAEGRTPRLVSLQVGEDPASKVYLRSQARAFERMDIPFQREALPEDCDEEALILRIDALNRDPATTGIMLQLPLPPHLNARRMRRRIHPGKDVEGIHPENLGALLSGRPTLLPCTAAAAIACIESTGKPISGKEAVVVGHSETVGKPVALLLLERLATVTTCHHATKNLAAHTSRAEILVVAVGKPGLITAEMVRPGAIVIDVGINEIRDAYGQTIVVGDVDFEGVREVASAITPVPGGVGPVTVSVLLENTILAARRGALA